MIEEFPNLLFTCNTETGEGSVAEIKLGRMMNWVREHNCGRRNIESADNAMMRVIGFHCLGCGEHKEIPLLRIKDDMSFAPKTKNFIISQKARVQFADDCNANIKGIENDTRNDT